MWIPNTDLPVAPAEYVERPFAHVYDDGGLRHIHLRGHQNILRRLLVHSGAVNLGVFMRKVFWRGLRRRRLVADVLEVAAGTPIDRVLTNTLIRITRSLPHGLTTPRRPWALAVRKFHHGC